MAVREFFGGAYNATVAQELHKIRLAERMTRDELEIASNRRFKNILDHARRFALYRDRIPVQNGLIPLRMINSKIPVLTRDAMLDLFAQASKQAAEGGRYFINQTGGSTGEPIRVIQDKQYLRWNRAGKIHFDHWSGYRFGAPRILVWGDSAPAMPRFNAFKRCVDWFKNTTSFDAFQFGPTEMRRTVNYINRVEPTQILGYVESLYDLARFIENEALPVHSPRSVMTSAGTLHDTQRDVIERAFGTKVFNRYGAREVGPLASECEQHEGLHVLSVLNSIEILAPDGELVAPGEAGEVVVTSLTNKRMPLIRYRIGDLAAWAEDPCSCGRSWPLIKHVLGRTSDRFLLPNGTKIHGEFFTHLLYPYDWIQRFQFVQKAINYILLRIVPRSGENMPDLERWRCSLEEAIRARLGNACRLELDIVQEIPLTSAGKHRYTVSEVVM